MLCMRIKSNILYTKKDLKSTKYDDTSDPCLYLCIYSNEESLITIDKDLHVNLLSFSLKGDALTWFARLSHASIENFDQLKSVFQSFYQIYIPKEVTFSNLMHIKQR